jgi:biotin carboxyl carrier protein
MTTYFVTVGANEYKVDIQNGQFFVNGEPLDVKVRRLNEQGLFLLQQGNRQLEVVMNPRDQNQVSVVVDRRHMTVQVTRGEGPRTKKTVAGGALSAPMPGTVIEIRVKEGQAVEKGDVIAVMESMKMQMEIRSPVKGVIKKVLTRAGAKVEKGSALAQVLEHPKD